MEIAHLRERFAANGNGSNGSVEAEVERPASNGTNGFGDESLEAVSDDELVKIIESELADGGGVER